VRPAFAAVLLLTLLAAATSCAAPAPTLTVTTVATGLVHPWDVAFTPDGTMLLTERIGKIDALVGGQVRTLAAPTDVFYTAESGMLGLAVDPAFQSNRRVYTCMTTTANGTTPRDVRVVRWTVDPTYTTLTNRTDILTGITQVTGEHAGCRIRFAPPTDRDTRPVLWVGTGDARVATAPQDKQSLAGKVLRIYTDGTPAAGNPGGAFDPRIYTYGHRNVQGLAFRPSDGMPFNVEHGTICDDEVNRQVAGGNYGWDPIDPLAGPSFYDEFTLMTDTVKFPDAIRPTWASGCPTVAPSGATFIYGTQWKAWDGMLAITTLKGETLYMLSISPDGTTNYGMTPVLTGYGRLRVAVQGPDGSLYIPTDADTGQILRVTPS
jgi:glucose/arabinose dehydrogenase